MNINKANTQFETPAKIIVMFRAQCLLTSNEGGGNRSKSKICALFITRIFIKI